MAPIQGTAEELEVRSYTDEVLASRLGNVNRRSVPAALRKAIIEEAARRLRWGTKREKGEQ